MFSCSGAFRAEIAAQSLEAVVVDGIPWETVAMAVRRPLARGRGRARARGRPRPPGVIAHYNASSPLGRMAEPCEVAEVTAWLLSDRASMVSGAIMPVDGGRARSVVRRERSCG